MKSPWKKLSTRKPYANPWLTISEDRVIRPDGTPGMYGVVRLSHSSAIVAIDATRYVYLVRQWRYPLDCSTIEVPWGGRDKDETYLACAKRELREETGLTAKQWKFMGKVADCPGIVDEWVGLYLARGLRQLTRQLQSEDSDQQVLRIPFVTAHRWAMNGKIKDAVTITALTRAKELLGL